MPISFSAAKSKALGKVGSSKDEFQAFIATTMLGQYADEFVKELEKNIKASKLTGATGDLGKTIGVKFSDEGMSFQILMQDYYDFVNEGVKGVRSTKNAATSPYKFKNYGMNAEGRASIKQYILSGKAKVRETKGDKARGVGLERKGISQKPKKSLIDSQVDNMIYMIKKYGIKKTDYFTDAFEKVFANWEQDIAEAYGEDIALSLSLKTNKK
jgi:hypothetical protein